MGLEIHSLLVLSTGHLSPETQTSPLLTPTEYGWFIPCYLHGDIPQDLWAIMQFALPHASYLLFDRDGDRLDELEYFDDA